MAKYDRVLFVRVDDGLLEALDHLTEKIQKTSPHRPVSRASVVRAALWHAIRQDEKAPKEG